MGRHWRLLLFLFAGRHRGNNPTTVVLGIVLYGMHMVRGDER